MSDESSNSGSLEVFTLERGGGRYRAMLIEQDCWDDWRALKTATTLREVWRPPSLRFYAPGETGLSGDRRSKPLPTDTDMPTVFGALMNVVSQRFVDLAGPAVERYGEFLPCDCTDGAFFVFHCTNVVDALDQSRSEFSRARGTGEILNVYKYAFHPERIAPDMVFRLEQGNQYVTFLGGRIDEQLKQLPLRGLSTERVWSQS
jgi:hypothetical protein